MKRPWQPTLRAFSFFNAKEMEKIPEIAWNKRREMGNIYRYFLNFRFSYAILTVDYYK